jgi:hypothetical protein
VIARLQAAYHNKEQIMNKTGKTGTIAIVIGIALVFAFIACDTGTSGGGDPVPPTYYGTDEDGVLYTLAITPSGKAAYTPKGGDGFKLTIGSNKTSTGSVNSFDSGSGGFELASNGGTFSVTVSSAGIAGMSGTIPLDGGGTHPAPSVISAGKAGKLTINGIDGMDNNYATAFTSDGALRAGKSFTWTSESVKVKGGQISGGSVTLNVWKKTATSMGEYAGNDQNVAVTVYIYDTDDHGNYKGSSTFNVNFSGGAGTINASNATW